MSQTTPIQATTQGENGARLAIRQAAQRTGVDFDYLLAQAKLESSLDPSAKARTSSATGLYQFINSTWLSVLDRHGAALGFAEEAAAIEMRGGKARVTDPAQRASIMALRFDPHASAMMAAALAQDNRAALVPVLGREPQPNELYLAHFLGAAGASRFLGQMQANPDQSAAALMPDAAAANRTIFYTRSGVPRSLAEVHDVIARKVARAMESGGAAQEAYIPPPVFASARTARKPAASLIPALGQTLPPLPEQGAPRPMAEVLKTTFAATGDASDTRAQAHASRAYRQLGAFGL